MNPVRLCRIIFLEGKGTDRQKPMHELLCKNMPELHCSLYKVDNGEGGGGDTQLFTRTI